MRRRVTRFLHKVNPHPKVDLEAYRKRRLIEGERWQRWLYEYFQFQGIICEIVPPYFVEPIIKFKSKKNHPFLPELELGIVVHDIYGNKYFLDIKHTNIAFTSTEDYPYRQCTVSLCDRWDKKDPKPFAVAIVSQKKKAVVFVPSSTQYAWVEHNKYNSKYHFYEKYYLCPSWKMRDMDWLKKNIEVKR